jgi:two-component system, LytTR family, response regulator
MNAIDYLLKPIAPRRLDEAIEKARTARDHQLLAETLESLARGLRRPADAAAARAVDGSAQDGVLERLSIRDGDGYRVLPVERIRWIQAVGNYVALHADGRELLHRATLQEMERSLPSRRFARIHRGVIVNLGEVAALHPVSHGDYRVMLKDGTELRMSRKYRSALLS